MCGLKAVGTREGIEMIQTLIAGRDIADIGGFARRRRPLHGGDAT